MCLHEDRKARGLIDATALHADDTVLDDVDDTDPVLTTELVELEDDLLHCHLLSIQLDRNTVLPLDLDIRIMIRCLLRCHRQHQHMIVVRLLRRILQLEALMRDMHEVPVTAVGIILGEGERDALRLDVVVLILTGLEGPDIRHTPRSDDIEIRGQCLDGQLETNLIISLTGCTMADRLRALLPCDLDQLLRDRRTRHRGTEQVLVLVGCIGLETRKHIVVAEVVRDILDVQLRRTRDLRTLCQTIQLVTLPYIDTAADHLIAEGLLQPRHDTGCIETTGVSQNDLLTLRVILWYQITHNHFSSIKRPRRINASPEAPLIYDAVIIRHQKTDFKRIIAYLCNYK